MPGVSGAVEDRPALAELLSDLQPGDAVLVARLDRLARAIGFGLVALASAVDSTWPLFLTPLPYAIIPWLVVHADDGHRGT